MTDAEHPLRAMLEAGLSALALDTALAGPLLAYLDLLQRWNATYNLTAIRDPRAMVTLHLLDSLAMHGHLDGVRTLADLGAGAGLPGIPLAIARPALQVTLVESNGKKARFLREAVRTLKLANAEVAESRIEAVESRVNELEAWQDKTKGGWAVLSAVSVASAALGGIIVKIGAVMVSEP